MEDLAAYFSSGAGFGVAATLAGVAVVGIFSTGSVDYAGGQAITQEPMFELQTSAAPSAAAGQALVCNGITYAVRAVEQLPPDALVTRLALARV